MFKINANFYKVSLPGDCHHGAHFVFEIALSETITLTLMLVCAFSPLVHSIPRGPRFMPRNDK